MCKKLIGLLMAASFVLPFAAGCSEENSNEPSGEVTVYEDALQAPAYKEISDTQKYTSYYFDSENGDDKNDGLSETAPKRTVSAANALIKGVEEEKPVQVLFKAGTEYGEELKIVSFRAAEETPLLIGSYGHTEENEYAKFTAEPYCVEISGSNVRVEGLETQSRTAHRGIYVYTSEAGATKNIVLRNNYIHDVNFLWDDLSEGHRPGEVPYETVVASDVCSASRYVYQNSGIYFTASTGTFPGASWFENVWIEQNKIERVSRCGIFINSDWARRPGLDWGNNRYYDDENGWYPHKNFNILNNDISFTGGDAIVLIAGNGGFIQGNKSYHAAYLGLPGTYTAGIWCHSSKNIVFQYNEASYTHLPSGTGDGQGYDIDIGCSNILFQYNYSHHNEGGGILLCNHSSSLIKYNQDGSFVQDEDGLPISETRHSPWTNNVIRNNVFADNGKTVFHIQGVSSDLTIANNVIVIPGETGEQGIVISNAWGDSGTGKNWVFANNVFCLRNKRSSIFDLAYCPTAVVTNNIFDNFADNFLSDRVGESTDCFEADTGLKSVQAADGLSGMNAFLCSDSRCLTAGKPLAKMLKKDYAGNATEGKNYIGAFCKTK